MLQESLSVNFREMRRIGDGLQDLRQVIRRLRSIHGRGLKSAGRGMVKTKSLKDRDDIIAQSGPYVTGVRNAQNHAPHRLPISK